MPSPIQTFWVDDATAAILAAIRNQAQAKEVESVGAFIREAVHEKAIREMRVNPEITVPLMHWRKPKNKQTAQRA